LEAAQVMTRTLALIGIALLVGLAPAAAADLAAGDAIAVTVLGEPTISGRLLVRPDGMISLPLAGEVQAAGRTTVAVAAELAQKLSEYIKNPQVTVDLVEQAKLKIAISGEVRTPGIYFVPPGSKLSEALNAAGGFSDQADMETVQLVRPGVGATQHSLPELVTPAGMINDPLLFSGDNLVVPRVTPERGYQVLGRVLKPGLYSLGMHGPVGVWEAITKAGGLAEKTAVDVEHATITRSNGERVVINLNQLLTTEGAPQVTVGPGDTLTVPPPAAQVFVLGAVNRPGPVLLRRGALLLEALAQAGGLTALARPKEASLLRDSVAGNGQPQRIPVDLERLLYKSDLSLNMALQEGDILVIPENAVRPRSALEKMGPLLPLLYRILIW